MSALNHGIFADLRKRPIDAACLMEADRDKTRA